MRSSVGADLGNAAGAPYSQRPRCTGHPRTATSDKSNGGKWDGCFKEASACHGAISQESLWRAWVKLYISTASPIASFFIVKPRAQPKDRTPDSLLESQGWRLQLDVTSEQRRRVSVLLTLMPAPVMAAHSPNSRASRGRRTIRDGDLETMTAVTRGTTSLTTRPPRNGHRAMLKNGF